MKIALALLLLTTASSQAQQPDPDARAHALLDQALKPEAMEVLIRRNYLLLRASKEPRALLHANWEGLKLLALHSRALQAFIAAYDKARAGQDPEGSDTELRPLADLPVGGLWTAGLKSAAETLAVHMETRRMLGPALAQEPLFATPWGADFRARTHAELLPDFRALAAPYFRDYIAVPSVPEGKTPAALSPAAEHMAAYIKAAYDKDVSSLLSADLAQGAASERLIGWLAKYLLDQRRIWVTHLTSQRLKALERSLSKDLADLRAALPPLGSALAAIDAAGQSLRAESASPALKISAERLHVHPVGTALPLDVGDAAMVSAAYWIDGLPPGESVVVTQAGFLDEGAAGPAELSVSSHKLKNGGPYAFTTRVPLRRSGQLKYRLVIGAPEANALRLETVIEVSPRLDDAIAKTAAAETLAAECRLEDSSQAFSSLEQALAETPGKPQFRKLLAAVKTRAKALQAQSLAYDRVMNALPEARIYAAAQACDFQAEAARRALSDLADLPPGCDKVMHAGKQTKEDAAEPLAAELRALLGSTEGNLRAQEAFHNALKEARAAEEGCRPRQAARLYATALALLDAEPRARCGRLEQEHARVRAEDLGRALSADAMAETLSKDYDALSKLYASRDMAATLAAGNELVARIDSLRDKNCYRAQRRRAEDLAAAAGVALEPPDPRTLSLPHESADAALKLVTEERPKDEPPKAQADRALPRGSAASEALGAAPAPAAERKSALPKPRTAPSSKRAPRAAYEDQTPALPKDGTGTKPRPINRPVAQEPEQ